MILVGNVLRSYFWSNLTNISWAMSCIFCLALEKDVSHDFESAF